MYCAPQVENSLLLPDAQKSYEIFPRGVCYILNTGTGTSLKIYEKSHKVQYTTLKTNHIQSVVEQDRIDDR